MKLFKLIGILFICIVGFYLALFAYGYIKSTGYDETAIPYIKKVIPEISSWDIDVLKKYSSAEALNNVSDRDLIKLMRFFSKLGEFRSMDEPQFVNVTTNTDISNGNQTIATFAIVGYYDNGEANITLSLLEVEGGFQIYHLKITSPALIE